MLALERLCKYVFFPIALCVWFWVSWLIWQDERPTFIIDYRIDSSINGPRSVSAINETVESIPPLVIQPIRNLLYAGSRDVNADNQLLIKIAHEYISRRPLDPDGWLWASLFYQRTQNVSEATSYLQKAYQLTKKNTPKLNEVFTRYLELGLIDESLPVARDISYVYPEQFRRLFFLISRLKTDYSSIVEQVIPRSVPTHRDYSVDIYYTWALRDAIVAKNEELASVIWDAVPDEIKSAPGFGLSYINYLANLQRSSDFVSAVEKVSGVSVTAGEIFNASFEDDIKGDLPCWEIRETPSAEWRVDERGYKDARSLLLEFNGSENVRYSHISCLISVESSKRYRLSGYWSGEDITTLSGPYISIYSPSVRGVVRGIDKRGEAKTGSWEWEPFAIEFDVPDAIEILSLRLRRAKTDYLDSKISGRVWFDEFKLEKVE